MVVSRIAVVLCLAAVAGCQPSIIALPDSPVAPPGEPLASRFNAAECGTLSGVVTWQGERPVIPHVLRPVNNVTFDAIDNPNGLRLGNDSGIAGAVVLLRGVDPAKSKPWPYPPVTVQLNERGIFIEGGRVGIVRRGESVSFETDSIKTFGVRGRGDDYFSHILAPKQNRVERPVNREGRVALTSASGQFWASADLIVSDHPYVALTDANGHYRFEQVPAGTYELRVYHPNWKVAGTEIDPESSLPVRWTYAPPFQTTGTATVLSGHDATMTLKLAAHSR